MDQVMCDINAKISPDSATGGFSRGSFSHQSSYYFYGVFPLEDDGDQRAGSNEFYQIVVESFSFMNGIVTVGQLLIHMQHLHSYDFEPLPFQATNYFSRQSPLYGIRLDKN